MVKYKCITLLLIMFLISSCKEERKDIKKVITEKETKVLNEYIEFAKYFRDKVKNNKDFESVSVGGSRVGKVIKLENLNFDTDIGYGNDAFSDLDIYISSRNIKKYCNCNYIRDNFGYDLCFIKINENNICMTTFIKNRISVDLIFKKENLFETIDINLINKFFMLAIETQEYLVRENLITRKKVKINNSLYELMSLFVNTFGNLEESYEFIFSLQKMGTNKENLQKILDLLVNKFASNVNERVKKNNLQIPNEMIFALKKLKEIKLEK